MRRALGFTLFEVMISLLVLTTAILATIALLPVGIKAQQLARSQMYASAAAMTLINNFHTPIDKFEGVSRLAPRYDGRLGDPNTTASAPFQGWAAAIAEQEIHASPYQPNLEQQMGWLNGVLPVPMEIARRLDSDNDEVQRMLDAGGVLLYTDPNFMMGLNQGAANDRTMQVLPAPELQKLVFGVTSLPQQNALSSLPAESFPWYEIYPFPPEWMSMQAKGRETRRLVGSGGSEGYADYFYPNLWIGWDPASVYPPKYYQQTFFNGNGRSGWPTPNPNGSPQNQHWVNQWWGPWPNFNRSGMAMCGANTGDWGICCALLPYDDGGHGLYEPVRFGAPMRPGQEQDTYFANQPLDDPDANDEIYSEDMLAPGASTSLTPPTGYGNGFAQGRNWRFFAKKTGGIWMDGTGAGAGAAWLAFQRLAGVNDSIVGSRKRNAYPTDPLAPDPDPQYQRSGWLPIKALLTNPDFPSYERLQNMDLWELVGTPWQPRMWPDGDTVSHHKQGTPMPAGTPDMPPIYFSRHPFAPRTAIVTLDDLTNLTWKCAEPRTVAPPATYEMRANYRDRAIDLWQTVMPRNSGAVAMAKNTSTNAAVLDSEGGTMVDCNKYEYPPMELDKFVFIRPDQLQPSDLPIHPAQVLALSYLAHAAMMVTGYSAPFSQDLQSHNDAGLMDTIKIPWECLNWTYAKSPLETNPEVSLWATLRKRADGSTMTPPTNSNSPPIAAGQPKGGWASLVNGIDQALPITPVDPAVAADKWERPFEWQNHFGPDPRIGTAAEPSAPPGASGWNWYLLPDHRLQWDSNYVQQFPVTQQVKGQGITKDALVVFEDAAPALKGDLTSRVKLCNDTDHAWNVYPGDELVFQISYYQWWYKYGKNAVFKKGRGPAIWGADDPNSIWDGRYDPDSLQWWDVPGIANARWWDPVDKRSPRYPSLNYQLQTFHVVAVYPNGSGGYNEASGAQIPTVSGAAGNYIEVEVTPPLPPEPIQFNDARVENYPGNPSGPYLPGQGPPNFGRGEMDEGRLVGSPLYHKPVALHRGTLVRRLANPHDIAFARKVYEMAMLWAAAYAAESPNDFGAPRPANRQIMTDKPLALYDLFYDAGTGTGNGKAVRVPQNRATSSGSSAALAGRRTESFYRWMSGANPVPSSWFYGGSAPADEHGFSHLGPGRERQTYFEQMVYNHQLNPPSGNNDQRRFWLTEPFSAFHRCRQLTFWSVDWKAYEDGETAPSAPMDIAKHDRYLHHDDVSDSYDYIAPWVRYGHSPLCGNPESLYVWTDPSRQQRYIDVVGGESAGYLYQNWIGGLGQPRPGLRGWATDNPGTGHGNWYPTQVDPPLTNGQRVTADVHLGHWGADRNGNGVLDVGPIPKGTRMRAVHVADFNYYDPVLRVHYGN